MRAHQHCTGVLAGRYDQRRAGANVHEHVLTRQNVGSDNFGKLWSDPVDRDAHAQPLYVYNVKVDQRGGAHNVLIVASVNDSVSQGPSVYFPGTNPTASAIGSQNGIIWDLDLSNFDHIGPAVLHAYDANTLSPLYACDASAADQAGPAVKFTSPVVADGQVFVPAAREVDVYGLRGNGTFGPALNGPGRYRRFRRR